MIISTISTVSTVIAIITIITPIAALARPKTHTRTPKKPHDKVSPDDHVEFFHDEEQLHDDQIPKDTSALWYRVVNPQDDGSFNIKWKNSYQSVQLCQSQLNEVAQEIISGATLGQLRRKVASVLAASSPLGNHGRAVIEPDQVLVEAVGGFRPGPIQGDNWELPPGDFFLFYGFNERYVLHRPSLDYGGTTNGHYLKTWLKLRILTTVCRSAGYLDGIRTEDISLFHRRRPVRDGAQFRSGKSFEFDLSRDTRNTFVQAEAWLLPLTETCSICTDDKRVSEMPIRGRITEDCEHDATACKECISQWITSSMETVAWDRLTCPECPEILALKDVEAFATRDVFNRYDKLATKAVLEGIKGFRWCLNPGCGAGQIFPSECEKAKCHACKQSSCVRHDVPWHSGETCEEYDRRTRKQRKSYKLSEKHVKETTKPCPGCKKNVNKYSGCDHITCESPQSDPKFETCRVANLIQVQGVCGYEWCWLCFAPYTKDNESFLCCKHAPECRYHRTPPFWEGRRALLPFLGLGGRRPPGARRFPIPMMQPEDTPLAMEDAGAEANRLGQNRPQSPELPPPDFPADLLDFLFDRNPFAEGPRPRRHGMPFINEALLF
ncbi:hypothetical protein E0Z10_g5667 [Xylaria hypoxylon]|uniref:RBR-type E3 ubiquitin transferase n=1 Tax=Xylaria hypoxylon TaxID=37992 RepID=A0A4Z0YVD0_9PEZI|nr:hypothetical protein E0Z10_g5667 [Xylaria hypoxylon]